MQLRHFEAGQYLNYVFLKSQCNLKKQEGGCKEIQVIVSDILS
jgi:hypothetical protein